MSDLFSLIDLDKRIKPVNIKIDKKTLYQNIGLNNNEKKIISECIERIVIVYILNSTNINIQPYIDDSINYQTVVYMLVLMRKKEQIEIISELLNQSIPNPIVLVFEFDGNILISTAHKRINKLDNSKTIYEKINNTYWLNLSSLNENEKRFINSINISNLPHTNFFEFYSRIDEAVYTLMNINLTYKFTLSNNEEEKLFRRELIEKINDLYEKLSKLQNQIKKEEHFNKKLELNIQAVKIKNEIDYLKTKLK